MRPDLVERNWSVDAPNELVVADFTYVAMADRWHAYTAFVVGAYAEVIVEWECSETKHTDLVESALRQVGAMRERQGTPVGGAIHHVGLGHLTPTEYADKWRHDHGQPNLS